MQTFFSLSPACVHGLLLAHQWTSIPVFGRLGLAVLGHVEAPTAEVVLAELAAVDLLREVDHGARRPAARLMAEDDGKQRHVHLGVDVDDDVINLIPTVQR